MTQRKLAGKSQRGMTLNELIIVMAVAATLMIIAVPSFLQWRQKLQYRTVASDLSSSLRFAQSSSVMQNRQYRVQFEAPQFGRYRVQQADRMVAGGWVNVADWVAIPQGITLGPANLSPNDSVDFNPNGTASNAATISIYASSATPTHRFDVQVTTTGRIKIEKP